MSPASQERSQYIAFFDECGDHSLRSIDSNFPLFLLSMIVVKRSDYEAIIIPELSKLKLRYWDHEGINFHSRDIRKAYGDFAMLANPNIRLRFLTDLSEMMDRLPVTLFISAIRKDLHLKRYGATAINPYTLALEFTLERLVQFLQNTNQIELPVIAEARGKNEDRDLEAAFQQLLQQGTRYISSDRFQTLHFPLSFRRKYDNIAGMQIADLCAHPCARKVLFPDKTNKAFQSVQPYIYQYGNTNGWKVFP